MIVLETTCKYWEMPKFIVFSLPINSGPSHSSVLTETISTQLLAQSYTQSRNCTLRDRCLSKVCVHFPSFLSNSLASVASDCWHPCFSFCLNLLPSYGCSYLPPPFLLLLYVCWWISYLYSGAVLVWPLISPMTIGHFQLCHHFEVKTDLTSPMPQTLTSFLICLRHEPLYIFFTSVIYWCQLLNSHGTWALFAISATTTLVHLQISFVWIITQIVTQSNSSKCQIRSSYSSGKTLQTSYLTQNKSHGS